MNRIVITGIRQPLAWRLGAALLDLGYSVLAVDTAAASPDAEEPLETLPTMPWDAQSAHNGNFSPGWFDGVRAVFDFSSTASGTEALVNAIAKSRGRALALVAASSLDVFGDAKVVDEASGLGPECEAVARERALRQLPNGRGRLVLARVAPMVRWVGGVSALRSSWIYETDAVRLLIHCLLTPTLEGAVHVAAPTRGPGDGVETRPERALKSGFQFQFPTVEATKAAVAENRADWEELEVVERAFWVKDAVDHRRFFPGSTGRYRMSLRGFPLAWETRRERLSSIVDGEELVRGAFQTFQRRQRVTALHNGTLIEDAVGFRVRGGALVGRWIGQAVRERVFAALDSVESLGDPSSFESQLTEEIRV